MGKVLVGFFGGVGLTILTLLFGSGAYWQYRESTLKTDQAQRERISKIHELRDKQFDTLKKIVENSGKYTEAEESFRKTGDSKSQIETTTIMAYLKLLKENYNELEKHLAHLEGRPPEDIPLDYIPPPPPSHVEIREN